MKAVVYYTKGLADEALAEVMELADDLQVVERSDRFAVLAIEDADLTSIRTHARIVDDVRILVGGPTRLADLHDLAELCKEAAPRTVSVADADGRGDSGSWSVTVSARNPAWRRGDVWNPAEVIAEQLHGADVAGTRRQRVDLRLQVDEDHAHLAVSLASPDKRHRDVPQRPGALRPTVAAAMIRIATEGLSATTTRLGIYDPFCGSGTIVAEAAVAGFPVYGSDIDGKAVQMTRQRLAGMARIRLTTVVDTDRLSHQVFEHDVANGFPARVNARVLVGNMPWGKQVKVGRHQELFDAVAALVAHVLGKGGAAALLTTNEDRLIARMRRRVKGAAVSTRRLGLLGQTPAIVTIRPARGEP
ncbi:MAG: TRM11 family SAM-dependent methyltransferase [Haloechinothrix sp.]